MPVSPPRHSYQHQKISREARRRDYDRKRINKHIYKSNRWRKISERYRQNNPLCVVCKAEGKATAADVVDHIMEIKDGGEAFNEANLQSLCHRHHNAKTAREREGRVKSQQTVSPTTAGMVKYLLTRNGVLPKVTDSDGR